MSAGLDDREYRKRTKALRALRHDCWLCGEPIDYTLPYTDAMSFTADHVHARSKGGALLGELRAAHRSCNSRRSNRGTTVTQTPKTVLTW